ncbi:hypothetical protein N9744_01290 [bacterium]|nr:hypothetical protein [bacterium]
MPTFTAANPDDDIRRNALSTAQVLIALGLDFTEANRVAVSRSISRLRKRGIVYETSRWRNDYSWSFAWVSVYFCADETLLKRRETEKAQWEADAPQREAYLAEIVASIKQLTKKIP